ncbi:hypothetical protein BJ508DRAFT_357924 [Ascobolus immersus RN42]|uniref:Uncharacterized protein n=1 Tax=Ascobolus immersus RN42 TaxID=1160509 RepID=A0A3N4IL23_ASCIM|nr:hypothetical protein BJ508DRAFT_357924 [Ascobolus immersus RN42]
MTRIVPGFPNLYPRRRAIAVSKADLKGGLKERQPEPALVGGKPLGRPENECIRVLSKWEVINLEAQREKEELQEAAPIKEEPVYDFETFLLTTGEPDREIKQEEVEIDLIHAPSEESSDEDTDEETENDLETEPDDVRQGKGKGRKAHAVGPMRTQRRDCAGKKDVLRCPRVQKAKKKGPNNKRERS